MNTTNTVPQTPLARKAVPGSTVARNQNLLLAGLAHGVRVYAQHGLTTKIASGHSDDYYEIWCREDGATRTEWCSCAWGQRVGDVETFNRGTRQVRTNGALPCTHILVRRWYEMSLMEREAVISVFPEMAPWRLFGFVAQSDLPVVPAVAEAA